MTTWTQYKTIQLDNESYEVICRFDDVKEVVHIKVLYNYGTSHISGNYDEQYKVTVPLVVWDFMKDTIDGIVEKTKRAN